MKKIYTVTSFYELRDAVNEWRDGEYYKKYEF